MQKSGFFMVDNVPPFAESTETKKMQGKTTSMFSSMICHISWWCGDWIDKMCRLLVFYRRFLPFISWYRQSDQGSMLTESFVACCLCHLCKNVECKCVAYLKCRCFRYIRTIGRGSKKNEEYDPLTHVAEIPKD